MVQHFRIGFGENDMYYLQHKYQDTNWIDLPEDNYPYADLERARRRAAKLAENSIAYGMVRVVDKKGRVYHTFAAGGGEIVP